ncbi:coenzyme F420-0:L-glutamate ligase [Oscillospiraceae bacterium MB08-C2-2]|nr:coenzyme F420-0:L-glutamate ligase [Oscillospiraceae bacterium MB08-C2-2]
MEKANEGKGLLIEVDGRQYARIPLKTHIITDRDTLTQVASQYIAPVAKPGDIAFISEKAVACTQKRAIPMKDIKPSWLARTLCRFVYKNPYGIGLSIPETMEMALRECGVIRILFAAFISVIGKLIGKRGWFYQIAGDKARSIDGPCDCTIPPYNDYVVLGPTNPDEAAKEASKGCGCPVAVVDINDLGGNILGISHSDMDKSWLVRILKDNPLGQSDEQTPIGIIRLWEEPKEEVPAEESAVEE